MSNIQFAVKLNAPDIEPRIRHPRIFEAFDALQSGEFLELSNDHDPKPLLYQFMMEREDTYTWEYIVNGPDHWRVAIGKK
ncbi:DUF2249 domain-containing protein [Psychrobacillus psychrodurans]|jgi:uncharacterized protein (DUF2249 family)|uniref:DUF2249 domain-containing protein n=1 Tax=Psychrobacillus TaxID=1221880 RepID=UPI0008E6409B|nr:DUF2249 domain-containing protein [Psychrobacillus psychrodurans]MCK1997585.1 DUF2249 domain-containing protein [Psychrobacillus psychrodurans]MCZ8540546.1 DUF2249 domain-containing protein [Psychrobacillus psychrodurans]SFM67959.1 Uncharacterized conserved protein, DUF2249 family [Psychrobacillus psychrodurans]